MTKILVVDNEPDTANAVKVILEDVASTVITAYDGRDCLLKAKNEKPDLILLDIMINDMSGWDVFKQIRKNDTKIKIAFVSVLDISPERIEELFKNGVSDYILKPFSKNEIIEKVRTIIA